MSINIPSSVEVIGSAVFDGCYGLSSLTVDENNLHYCSINNVLYNKDKTELITCITSIQGEYDIPNTVTHIDIAAFSHCQYLSSINIPNSVTNIGAGAFDFCSGLTSITVPSSVSSIEEGTFRYCSKLGSVVISDGVTSIGNYAFDNCRNITSLYIPKSVTNIGNWGAFPEWLHLKSLYWNSPLNYRFNFSTIDEIYYGDDITIVYPLGNVKKVVLGKNVEFIRSESFLDSPLKEFYITGEKDIYLYPNVFGNVDLNNAKLYVPKSKLEYYKSTAPWSNFGTIEAIKGPEFNLTYIVDGNVYKTFVVEQDSEITAIEEPVKEGYTFSGWSEVPSTMPGNDVEVVGTFTINQYNVKFVVDGKIVSDENLNYGSSIVAPKNVEKEGYTFNGWYPQVETTVPAHDVSYEAKYSINSYKLKYILDGKEYKSMDVVYGTNISAIDNPTKEGYTFSGWSYMPETMPAKDVEVIGSFSINQYTITFNTDGGTTVSPITADYGSTIQIPTDPTKTGYTFLGWDKNVPATMPAYDLSLTAQWKINSYKLSFVVDGKTMDEKMIEYGSNLSTPDDPQKEGYTFSGWSYIPETMPAKDVTVVGSFIVNKYKITYIFDGEIVGEKEVEYGTPIPSFEYSPANKDITINYWYSDAEYTTMPAKDIVYNADFTNGINSIVNNGKANVYAINGTKVKSNAEFNEIKHSLKKGIYIINGKKVIIK